MNEFYLKDIKHDRFSEERVCDWDFIDIPDVGCRLYYKQSGEIGLGFYFYALESEGRIDLKEGEWHPDCELVSCVVTGMGYFDGIRHLYYGDEQTDNYGYHYYATVGMVIRVLDELSKLEDKFCRDKQ